MSGFSYAIGVGWFCPDGGRTEEYDPYKKTRYCIPADEMFSVWQKNINAYCNPEAIIIVDSNSDVPPPYDHDDDRFVYIRMRKNFHPKLKEQKFIFGQIQRSAASRQMYLSAMYAWVNDIDYYVWIEQDCMISGKGIIEAAIENMGDADISMGRLKQNITIEPCLTIFRTESFPQILTAYIDSKKGCPRDLPERKYKFMNSENIVKFAWHPFGYGRDRPLDFTQKFLYAQRVTLEEMGQFKTRLESETQ